MALSVYAYGTITLYGVPFQATSASHPGPYCGLLHYISLAGFSLSSVVFARRY